MGVKMMNWKTWLTVLAAAASVAACGGGGLWRWWWGWDLVVWQFLDGRYNDDDQRDGSVDVTEC